MLKVRFIFSVVLIACFMALPALLSAQKGPEVSFSADFVEVEDGITTKGKFYAGPLGIRMEGTSDGEPYLLIVNLPQSVSWMVQVDEGMYFELPFNPQDSGTFFDPCPELSRKKTMVGRETLDGRTVEKWQCTMSDGRIDTVWFDERLKATVRRQGKGGSSFELRNIKEGALSKDLFQVPAGFMKIAIPGFPGF
jgi:hypothetical protein